MFEIKVLLQLALRLENHIFLPSFPSLFSCKAPASGSFNAMLLFIQAQEQLQKKPWWYHQRWRSHNSKMATPGKGEISTVTSDGFPRSNREFYAEKKETNNLFTLRQKMRLGKKERKKESCRSYHAQNQFQDSAHRGKENSLITGIKPFG